MIVMWCTCMSASHILEHFAKSKSNEHMDTYGPHKPAARNKASIILRLSMAVFAAEMISDICFEASTVNGRSKRPVTSLDLCHAGSLVAGQRLVASRSGWSRSE